MTPQTKQRILRAAREEFLRHGYGQASLRRIAAAAHVTTGAVYNHFRSKHGLFDAIVRRNKRSAMESVIPGMRR